MGNKICNYQLLEEAAKVDISEKGGFLGWYDNYLARKTGDLVESLGLNPVSDNKETEKISDSDDDSKEDESEIITLNDDGVETAETSSQDDDIIITEQSAQANADDGLDLDSVEESVDSGPEAETNVHAIFRSVDGEGGFKRQVVVTHALPR